MRLSVKSAANCISATRRPAGVRVPVGRRTLMVSALNVGDSLPDFTVKCDTGAMVSSKDMVKDSGAVLFFYPRANTSGCTNQACGFRDNLSTFEAAGYKIYGMSADQPEAQAEWKKMHDFPYPLLCDPSFEVLTKLGVTKENNTKVNRSHLVIAKGGKVIDTKIGVKADESVPEALKIIANAKQI